MVTTSAIPLTVDLTLESTQKQQRPVGSKNQCQDSYTTLKIDGLPARVLQLSSNTFSTLLSIAKNRFSQQWSNNGATTDNKEAGKGDHNGSVSTSMALL